MFATFRRFRRHVAVLATLAMLASVLVAVPAVAADDPNADYTATFDACEGAPSSGFSDVPTAHANAGDIDCIAYYGITQGTSATTYSPLQSVTREHMALFLVRLAGVVGIEMADEPDDPGFSDTGDLSEESQAAIAQLADLDITQGTSSTTYSPADSVSRAQMALFIQRLMNNMSQLADGDPSLGSTTVYGYLPSDVDANKRVKVLEGGVLQPVAPKIGAPFADLSRSSRDEADAVDQLWELGVASGISDTAYSPGSDITRAAMAGFMAAVLDHSNARPAGLSIQVTPESGWGAIGATVLVSYRDDSFAPVEDMAIDMFSSAAPNNGLRKDGTCNLGDDPDEVGGGDLVTGDCVWDTNDDVTDVEGNTFLDGEVAPGKTRVFSAWVGEDDGDSFDADKFDAVTDSSTAMPEQDSLKVTSTINKYAACYNADAAEGVNPVDTCPSMGAAMLPRMVDLSSVSSVTYTVQLVDEDRDNVERADIEIDVGLVAGTYRNTLEDDLVTNDKGQIEFTVTAPNNSGSNNDDRSDTVTFTGYHPGKGRKVIDAPANRGIRWAERPTVLTTTVLSVDDYVLERRDEARVNAVVKLYDQYGNSHRSHSSQKVLIAIGSNTDENDGQIAVDGDPLTNALLTAIDADDGTSTVENMALRGVVSRGFARWARTAPGESNQLITVVYDVRQLARNSDGVAVQLGADAVLADTDLDDLDITYNDGRVAVASSLNADGDVILTTTVNYHIDDDEDSSTSAANDDDTPDEADAPAEASDTLTEVLITRNIGDTVRIRAMLSTDARDLHVNADPLVLEVREMGKAVPIVIKADSNDVDDEVTVTHIFADDDVFLADNTEATDDDDDNPELVYSYDSDDLYIDTSIEGGDGAEISMEKFEARLGGNFNNIDTHAVVEVLVYDVDGQSIFRIITRADGS